MMKIKKGLITRIVSLLIAIVFIFAETGYSTDGFYLRVPLQGSARVRKAIEFPGKGLAPAESTVQVPPRFLKGRIYDPDFIHQQRQISQSRLTVVFDLFGTVVVVDAEKKWVLREDAEQEFRRLKENGARLILWTDAKKTRPEVVNFFAQYPDISPYFDLVITQENFQIVYAHIVADDGFKELKKAFTAAGFEIIQERVPQYIWMLDKIVSLLFGNNAIIVEDNPSIKIVANIWPSGTFKIILIEGDGTGATGLANAVLSMVKPAMGTEGVDQKVFFVPMSSSTSNSKPLMRDVAHHKAQLDSSL